MKRFTALTLAGSSLLILCLGTIAPTVSAAASNKSTAGEGQALEIAPPLITLTANPGQVIHTQLKLLDASGGKLLVTNEINDFTAAGEDGTPKILTGNDSNYPFGLRKWITPLPDLLLSPNQIHNLNITIRVPTNASPGGHFGVIRFTGTAPQLKGSGVSLSASLGALVLMTVRGNIKDDLSVTQFTANQNGKNGSVFQSAPINFTVKLHNTGDIQEQPTGHIIVTDMFGKSVVGMVINAPPHDVLPDSTRAFTAAINKTNIGTRHLFGKYTAQLSLTYGYKTSKTLNDTITFWVIPYELIGIILVLLIAAFFVLRYLLRRYNRSIIARAQGGQKSKSKQPRRTKRK